jgi:D-threo-aldose 1-dehydrogenase
VAVVHSTAPYGGGLPAKGPREDPRYLHRPASAVFLERAQRTAAARARSDVPVAATALQCSLRDPRVTSTIVGFTRA